MIESVGNVWMWGGFLALIGLFLALDLGLFHKRDEVIGARQAMGWMAVWACVALLFDGVVWWRFGAPEALDFLTGYLIELSLSVDNLFVFLLIIFSVTWMDQQRHQPSTVQPERLLL